MRPPGNSVLWARPAGLQPPSTTSSPKPEPARRSCEDFTVCRTALCSQLLAAGFWLLVLLSPLALHGSFASKKKKPTQAYQHLRTRSCPGVSPLYLSGFNFALFPSGRVAISAFSWACGFSLQSVFTLFRASVCFSRLPTPLTTTRILRVSINHPRAIY